VREVNANEIRETDVIKNLRDTFSTHLNDAWPDELLVLWQNMPIPELMPNKGWIRFLCHLDRLRPLGLSRQHQLIYGRLVITIATPKGAGMAEADKMADRLIKLFSVSIIDNIRIGQMTMDSPRDEKSHHLSGLNIRFTTVDSLNDRASSNL
jgi:hypothetical protein